MKKLILALCVVLTLGFMSTDVFAQQGKFKGIVKYKLTFEGEVPQGAPTTFEMKVYEQKLYYNNILSMGEPVIVNAENNTTTSLFDFSQFPVEGAAGKWYVRNKIEPKDLEKVSYEITSETKTIAGKKAKKVNVVIKTDAAEQKETIWMCDEIGPKMDLSFYPGLKGMPFEFPVELNNGAIKITFTAEEVLEGKVKETDLLIPTGYEEVSMADFEEIIKLLMKSMPSNDDI